MDVLREDREAVVLADRFGYREAYIGEHLVDSAETITSSLALRHEVGGFGTLLYTGHDWADPALARRSMELMANVVWPCVVGA